MANIELVIKVDEKIYQEALKSGYSHLYDEEVANAVANGTPLPKGHGRLGDLDALRDEVSSWGMNDYEPSDFTAEIDETDTIIEADAKIIND